MDQCLNNSDGDSQVDMRLRHRLGVVSRVCRIWEDSGAETDGAAVQTAGASSLGAS